jgi:membrane protease YdiL (CAAX protease family)
MLTFAIGVFTQQWHIAIMGIVYSYITAAAMWENFRARLPYLYDPWSEKIPPPPTLMHAMIAISILVEVGAIATGITLAAVGRENIAVAQVIVYGICAFVVSIATWKFLSTRGVRAGAIWCWPPPESARPTPRPLWWCGDGTHGLRFLVALALGAGGGLCLGLFAHGYLALVSQIPSIADMIHKAQAQMNSVPGLRGSYALIAVFLAPFAEEFLFRGLLFRALDREWGGWRAIIGSAAFFAIYHPPLSWFPVGLLGIANALIFKKTGRLAPAVILHMVYNAVVVS